jgi:hypothetical protein
MAEPEEEKKEPQPEGGNPAAPPGGDGKSSPEDLAVIKAELEEERKAKAEIEALIAQKDATIAELQAQLNELNKAKEATAGELNQLKDVHSKAVSKYLDAVRLANSELPADVIAGSTIDEIDASVQKAIAIAESVKKAIEAQAREATVPAGAPARGGISVEGLSPREKIAAGLQQKIGG